MDKSKFYVDDDTVSIGLYDRPIYFQCEDTHIYKIPSEYKIEYAKHRCGLDSMYLITYWLPLSEQWHTKHVCELCLSHYIKRYGLDKFIFENKKG